MNKRSPISQRNFGGSANDSRVGPTTNLRVSTGGGMMLPQQRFVPVFYSSPVADCCTMNRAILSLCRSAPLLRRGLHKGVDSTPPLRWTSVGERIALYCAISITFLSYPTYVLLNLDNLRPK
ncbi:hypothetical protein NECAME_11641, partial [Necator americanus]